MIFIPEKRGKPGIFKEMRIAIDGHSLEGQKTGVGRIVFNLLKYWATDEKNEFLIYFKKEIPSDLPRGCNFHYRVLEQKSDFCFNQFGFPRAARKDKAEILFCPAYQIPVFFKQKAVLVIHDIIYEAHPEWHNWNSWLEKIIFKKIFKISAEKATSIITPSQTTKEEVIKHYKIAEDKIRVCQVAADDYFLEAKVDAVRAKKMKKELGISRKYILFVGSLFTRRHPRDLLAGFKEFRQAGHDYQLVLVGRDLTSPAQEIDKLSAQINEEFGFNCVIRVDYANDKDLVVLYDQADIFVYLSDYEGFGLPPLEVMHRGVPVITSNQSSLAEIAGSAAFLIENNNSSQEIANAFARVSEDKNLRQELVNKGLARVKDFSWAKCAQEMLEVILDKKIKNA